MIQAKFQVQVVEEIFDRSVDPETKYCESIIMRPVYSQDPDDPNHVWSQATPSGRLEMQINNDQAFGQFKVGQMYLLSFELVE